MVEFTSFLCRLFLMVGIPAVGTPPAIVKIKPSGKIGISAYRSREAGFDVPPVQSHDEFHVRQVRMAFQSGEMREENLSFLREKASDFGLSTVPNSHNGVRTERKRRGLNGISSHGREQVFSGCEYLQWRFGAKHLSFCTVTLPDVTKEECAAIAENWSEIVRQFIQSIRRKLDAKGNPSFIVGCSEIQQKRFDRTGVPALHLHLVFVGRKPYSTWVLSAKDIAAVWRNILSSLVLGTGDRDWTAVENLQGVRSSASAYLAKYLSKGVQSLRAISDASERFIPSAWYTLSRVLSRLVRSSVRTGREAAMAFAELSRVGARESTLFYLRPVSIESIDGYSKIVGWHGKLKPGWGEFMPLPINPSCPLELKPFPWELPHSRRSDGFGYLT